jgi:cytochrome c oxidase subunit 2
VFAQWVKAKGGTMPANGAPAAEVAKTPSAVETGEPTAMGNAAAEALPAEAPVAGAIPANTSAGN